MVMAIMTLSLCYGNIVLSSKARCIIDPMGGEHCFQRDTDYLTPGDERILHLMRTDKVSVVLRCPNSSSVSTLLVTLASGISMKCKNGRESFFKMEGTYPEVFAFYFDRLLRGGYVLPSAMVKFSGSRWKEAEELYPAVFTASRWRKGDGLVCSQYVTDVNEAALPAHWPQESLQLNVPRALQRHWTPVQRNETMLWGHVIAFDYIAGIYERLTKALSGIVPRSQRRVQSINLNNCAKVGCQVENAWTTLTGQLILVDNNSAFWYDEHYLKTLTDILEDTCIFPQKTLDELKKRNPQGTMNALMGLVARHEPEVPTLSFGRTQIFLRRLQSFMEHAERCRNQYKTVSF